MSWRIRSDELRRRRIEKMLDRAELAHISGISLRALALLEASDKGVTVTTLDALTKPLACARSDIATYVDARTTAKGSPATTATTNGAPHAKADRPRMSDLRAIQRTLPEPATLEVDGAHLPMLSVIKYNQCFSAYLARDGERYWVEGIVADDRGLPPAEAALLGARSGEATRIDLRCPVGDGGDTLCVTAHTVDGATTIAMQDASEKNVVCVVRVVALKDLAPGAGLVFFMRERPSPWGLVVERVIRVTPVRAAAPKGAKRATRARGRDGHHAAK